MPHSHRKKVFPFLLDDPLCVRQVREEKIVSEVKEALESVLYQKMVQIISDIPLFPSAGRLVPAITRFANRQAHRYKLLKSLLST